MCRDNELLVADIAVLIAVDILEQVISTRLATQTASHAPADALDSLYDLCLSQSAIMIRVHLLKCLAHLIKFLALCFQGDQKLDDKALEL